MDPEAERGNDFLGETQVQGSWPVRKRRSVRKRRPVRRRRPVRPPGPRSVAATLTRCRYGEQNQLNWSRIPVLRLVTLTWIRAAALALLVAAAPVGAAEPPAVRPVVPLAAPAPGGAPAPGVPAEPTAPRQARRKPRCRPRPRPATACSTRALSGGGRGFPPCVRGEGGRRCCSTSPSVTASGAVDQALFYYDRYLAGWPDASIAPRSTKVAELEGHARLEPPRAPRWRRAGAIR